MTRGASLRLKRAEAYYEHLDEELLPPASRVRKWFEANLYALRAWHALHVWADRVRDGEPNAVYALPTRVQPWGVLSDITPIQLRNTWLLGELQVSWRTTTEELC
ncbi:hypothetical protein T492DRAFT_859824 [Pavlovales sp. CCMP2436]|nr:hypothetical protein T492DRAFT_859824 [Pavlovales sp. CCMP2436]